MKDGQLIAKFNHNDKTFKIIYEHGKLKFIILDKHDNCLYYMSDEEKSILIGVIKSLMIDAKHSHYVRKENINNRLYTIYYDNKNKNFFWKSDNYLDNSEDNILLNIKYNHMTSVIYFRNKNDDYEYKLDQKLRKYYKDGILDFLNNIHNSSDRLYEKELYIKYGKKDNRKGIIKRILVSATLSFFVLSTAYLYSIFNLLPDDFSLGIDSSISATIDNEYKDSSETKLENNISNDDIQNNIEYKYIWGAIKGSIKSNKNLTDIEKEFLYKLKFVFDENYQYMDLDIVLYRLQTLNIKYINEPNQDPSIAGLYISADNCIEIYNASNFSDADISIFLHEFFHILQSPLHANLTMELSNELFSREAFRRMYENGDLKDLDITIPQSSTGRLIYSKGYEGLTYMYYDLAEILSSETLCKFQFQIDEKILVDELCKNSISREQDEQRAWYLIDAINSSKEAGNTYLSIPEELKKYINEEIVYFSNLNNVSTKQNINYFANHLSFTNIFTEYGLDFLLDILDKNQYLAYSDILELKCDVQMKSYFSNSFPETIIFLTIEPKTDSPECFKLGSDLLNANGDYGQRFVIVVDKEIQQQYSEYALNYSNYKNR